MKKGVYGLDEFAYKAPVSTKGWQTGDEDLR